MMLVDLQLTHREVWGQIEAGLIDDNATPALIEMMRQAYICGARTTITLVINAGHDDYDLMQRTAEAAQATENFAAR